MRAFVDGPSSPLFTPVRLKGNAKWSDLKSAGAPLSEEILDASQKAPQGACVFWGIPFEISARPILLSEAGEAVTLKLAPVKARWLVIAHTSDVRPLAWKRDGFLETTSGAARLGEHAATYTLIYADGSEVTCDVRRRREIGPVRRRWGENCVEAVTHGKPRPIRQEDQGPTAWGASQTRASANDMFPWTNWLWAWENPYPSKSIAAIRFEPGLGVVVISAVSRGNASECPIRWRSRQKAVLRLPAGAKVDQTLDAMGNLAQVRLDMGMVISATPRTIYPDSAWSRSYNNQLPRVETQEAMVEFSAHPDARFHLPGGKSVPVAKIASGPRAGSARSAAAKPAALRFVAPAEQRVKIRVVDRASGQPVPVKLHAHGEAGEHLPPLDRHRQPNSRWFEDYCAEFQHQGIHKCVYIPGETEIRLPLGKVFLEVSKGFEIRPVRRVYKVGAATHEIAVEIERVLPWREKGWVTADTHVHFLSPTTGLLEGAGEGVNVINLLASQWGELMTNAGDFDGKTTHGSREAGGDGEYLLRVGSENRHHLLGHISLLGYNGPLIAPMTSGGPDESAIGDPVEVLLSEWARQCKRQGGLVVIPHFPNPRLEHAAAIVDGGVDAVEMTSWGSLYAGIDPYSLSDWYRYLNNGYLVAAVGGTDKMSATTAVGTVRTYAKLAPGREFTYDTWMEAVRRAETFATYGPLIEMQVDGRSMGSHFRMSPKGGTIEIAWKAASVTLPMSKVELIANGAVVESEKVHPEEAEGRFTLKVERSTWVALLVRGHYRDKPEIIAAHSSPVMVEVAGSEFYSAADAMTILEQIEGALAYIDTVGTKAETTVYKRMRMLLTATHRRLHNRMHARGVYHDHTLQHDHEEHRRK